MSGHKVIRDVTAELVKRLRDGLCPEIIQDTGSVGFTNGANNFDYILTLSLYDITKADATLLNGNGGYLALRLGYMLVATGRGEPAVKAFEEQAILGGAMEIFASKPFISGLGGIPVVIEMNNLSLYDKSNMNGKRLALFYSASPVLIDITAEAKAPRVIHVGDAT